VLTHDSETLDSPKATENANAYLTAMLDGPSPMQEDYLPAELSPLILDPKLDALTTESNVLEEFQ